VSERTAATRFANRLRYRAEDDPAQTALTPLYILAPIRAALGGSIGLDPATTGDNPCDAERFYYPPMDGAALPWDAGSIFCNPPYGKARERWVERCIEAGGVGRRVILLIPAATDTRIVQMAIESAAEAVFVRGRVKFTVMRPNRRQVAASHPSVLIGWNVDLSGCAHLGLLMRAPHRPGPRIWLETPDERTGVELRDLRWRVEDP
jgi:hypothetical protein